MSSPSFVAATSRSLPPLQAPSSATRVRTTLSSTCSLPLPSAAVCWNVAKVEGQPAKARTLLWHTCAGWLKSRTASSRVSLAACVASASFCRWWEGWGRRSEVRLLLAVCQVAAVPQS